MFIMKQHTEITPFTQISSADNRLKFANFFHKMYRLKLVIGVCKFSMKMHLNNYKIPTKKPRTCSVVLEIVHLILRKNVLISNFLCAKIVTTMQRINAFMINGGKQHVYFVFVISERKQTKEENII